ncbi:MAG: hypothetical protein U5L05_17830 [Rubrivivax sp.]|nr:hypothetical protein [Rubrivivax sp.]
MLFTSFGPLQMRFGNEAVPLHVPVLLAGGLVFFLAIEIKKLIIRSSSGLKSFVTGVEAGGAAPGGAV